MQEAELEEGLSVSCAKVRFWEGEGEGEGVEDGVD